MCKEFNVLSNHFEDMIVLGRLSEAEELIQTADRVRRHEETECRKKLLAPLKQLCSNHLGFKD